LIAIGLLAAMLHRPLAVGASGARLADAAVACGEALTNGGFEAGAVGWTQSSAGGYALISGFYPHAGQWGAFLGGANDADDALSQQIQLPAAAVSITLTAWWAIATEEAEMGFDRLTATVRRPDGTLAAELWTVDSSAAVNVWQPAETDLTAYRGQTLVLQFRATTDASNPTDFYLDDISLWVCAAGVTVYLPLLTR
jgi:kumamolisin